MRLVHTLHTMSSSKEKLSKLSKAVSNLDPKVVVKDFWHVQCSCGTAVKLNHELLDLRSIDGTHVVACIEL